MSTLTTFRAALRLDLNDPVGTSARWTDADLDRAISRAVFAYAEILPRVQSVVLTTTAGSRIVPVTSLGTITTILSVEWPVPLAGVTGEAPRPPWRHDEEAGSVTLVGPGVPAGEPVRIRWSGPHVVDGSGSTIPEGDEALVILGAAGHACMAFGTPASDNFRYTDGEGGAAVDDTAIGPEWRSRADELLARFDRDLRRLGGLRSRSVRARLK